MRVTCSLILNSDSKCLVEMTIAFFTSAYIWRKDKRSTFKNTARPRASLVSLGMLVCAAFAINNYCVYVNYNCLRKQLVLVCGSELVDRNLNLLCAWNIKKAQLLTCD